MAQQFTLSIVAPDRSVLEEPVQSVILPGSQGYMGVLRGHVPMIASLKAGYVEYEDASNERHYVAVSGGFVEVTSEKVSVLADAAEPSSEIDVTRAEAKLEQARQALRGGDSSMTREEAVREIEKGVNRVNVAAKR